MAPSHSTPEQCAKIIRDILYLVDSIDNKVLVAYHDYLARKVTYEGQSSEELQQHSVVCTLMALKIQRQFTRNQANLITHYQKKESAE